MILGRTIDTRRRRCHGDAPGKFRRGLQLNRFRDPDAVDVRELLDGRIGDAAHGAERGKQSASPYENRFTRHPSAEDAG
jgi:hypothetical protein